MPNNAPFLTNNAALFTNNAAFLTNNTAFLTNNAALFTNNTALFTNNTALFTNNAAFLTNNAALFTKNAAFMMMKMWRWRDSRVFCPSRTSNFALRKNCVGQDRCRFPLANGLQSAQNNSMYKHFGYAVGIVPLFKAKSRFNG